jgi:hypothetical protein
VFCYGLPAKQLILCGYFTGISTALGQRPAKLANVGRHKTVPAVIL